MITPMICADHFGTSLATFQPSVSSHRLIRQKLSRLPKVQEVDDRGIRQGGITSLSSSNCHGYMWEILGNIRKNGGKYWEKYMGKYSETLGTTLLGNIRIDVDKLLN